MRGNTNYDMLSKETKNYIVKLTDGKFEITEEIYRNKKEYSTCVEYNNDKMDKYLTKKTKLNFPTPTKCVVKSMVKSTCTVIGHHIKDICGNTV